MPTIRRAIFSVSDKTDIELLGRALTARGIELIASGGTAQVLRDHDCPVTEVSEFTGAPEMLGGRVKTLHPKIHGGILARRHEAADLADLARQEIGPIDLVVVNLYPFEATIAQEGIRPAEAIEKIDIGGPTLLRAAAKNYRDVVTLCDPKDYQPLIDALDKGSDTVSEDFALTMAKKTFAHIAQYDAAISNWFQSASLRARPQAERGNPVFPAIWTAQYTQLQPLRYGENPHQAAAWFQMHGEAPWIGPPLQGKELSYNNLLDVDAAISCVRNFADARYAVVIIKHGNPCGVGTSDASLLEAFARAKASDPVSAFGGIVAVSQELDLATAEAIAETFFEVICAPHYHSDARTVFARKQNLRIVPYDVAAADVLLVRSACGGRLVQQADSIHEDAHTWKVATKRMPSDTEREALAFAWRVCKHVRSNAIVFAQAHASLGIGAGQMSRVDAVRIAVEKTGARSPEVAASDAFFPFRDGLDLIAQAGVRAVVQPGGSVRDNEVIAAADEHDMAMLFTSVRHFKH